MSIKLPTPVFGSNLPTRTRVVLTPSAMTRLTSTKPPRHEATPCNDSVLVKSSIEPKPELQAIATEMCSPRTCKYCEMDFPSEETFNRHRRQHISCEYQGCKFHSIREIMDIHVHVHCGLYNKYKNLSTPEEVTVYNAERRKLYPTTARVEQKRLAEEQRKRRGELLEARKRRFATPEMRRQIVKIQRSSQILKKQSDWQKRKLSKQTRLLNTATANSKSETVMENQKVVKVEPPVAHLCKPNPVEYEKNGEFSCFGVPMFRGTADMIDYKHVKEPKSKNKLIGLLAMYNSDDEDDRSDDDNNDESSDDAPEERPIMRIALTDSSGNQTQLKQRRTKNILGRTKNYTKEKNNNKPKRSAMLRSGLNYSLIPKNTPYDILSKLMEDTIRHEHNQLLQCVRYVCDKNFFGVGQKPETTAAAVN